MKKAGRKQKARADVHGEACVGQSSTGTFKDKEEREKIGTGNGFE